MKEFFFCHSLKTAYPEGAKAGGEVVGLGPNSENLRIGSLSFSDFLDGVERP